MLALGFLGLESLAAVDAADVLGVLLGAHGLEVLKVRVPFREAAFARLAVVLPVGLQT